MTANTLPPSRFSARLELSATILLIVVTLLVGGLNIWDRLYQRRVSRPPIPSAPISIADVPIRGDKNARVALIEFSDFECPFCGKAAREILPEIDRAYLRTGKVLLAWRHYPLQIHANAQAASEAAECAGRQNRFWNFHDWAFEHPKELDKSGLRAGAAAVGLDLPLFGDCLQGQATAKVKADFELGNKLSVSGTPTWFIGIVQAGNTVKVRERLTGSVPLDDFRKALDNSLKAISSSPN